MVTIKSKREIELMREAGRVAAITQQAIEKAIKPGISTWELDQIAEKTMIKNRSNTCRKRISKRSKRYTRFSRLNMRFCKR